MVWPGVLHLEKFNSRICYAACVSGCSVPRAMPAAPLEHSTHLDTSPDKCVSVLTSV